MSALDQPVSRHQAPPPHPGPPRHPQHRPQQQFRPGPPTQGHHAQPPMRVTQTVSAVEATAPIPVVEPTAEPVKKAGFFTQLRESFAGNPDDLPLTFAMRATMLDVEIDQTARTVRKSLSRKRTAFPVAGARADVVVGGDANRGTSGGRLAGGLAAGALVAPPLALLGLASKQHGSIHLLIVSADQQHSVIVQLEVKKDSAARKWAAEFNTHSARLAAAR